MTACFINPIKQLLRRCSFVVFSCLEIMHLKPFDHEVHSLHVGSPVYFQVCAFMRNSVRPPVALPVVSLSMPYAFHTHLVFALLL